MKGFIRILILFFASRQTLVAQGRTEALYGLSINNGITQPVSGPESAGVNGLLRAVSFYVHGGARYALDSILFEASLRYGVERGRLEKEFAPGVYYYYHARNKTFALCLSAGLRLSRHRQVHGGLNVVRIFADHSLGSGSRSGGYQYQLVQNQTPECWDFRPTLRYQFQPRAGKKTAFFAGIEASVIPHKAGLKNVFLSSNFTEEYDKINYNLIILSAGISL